MTDCKHDGELEISDCWTGERRVSQAWCTQCRHRVVYVDFGVDPETSEQPAAADREVE